MATAGPTGNEIRNHRRAGGVVEQWNPGAQEWEEFTVDLSPALDYAAQPGLRLKERPTQNLHWSECYGKTPKGQRYTISTVGYTHQGAFYSVGGSSIRNYLRRGVTRIEVYV